MDNSNIATKQGGLTSAEVAERVAKGQVNKAVEPPGRSFAQIFAANAFTPVNFIMLVLFVLVLISGNPADGLFVGVVISNTVVGVVQEIRARRELERLEVLTEAQAVVIRDGETMEIDVEDVVLDDLVMLSPGAQSPVDGVVTSSKGLQLDESLLTGESDLVEKDGGDMVLSGSFVAVGSGTITAHAVGADSFAGSLTTEARTFSAAQSLLRMAVNRILRWLIVIIPIASGLLFISLITSQMDFSDALQGTVAAAVAMVPDGLVLLTSIAFVAGIIEFSRKKALARELSTVETLARVDVLVLDKTGTITSGEIAFAKLHPLGSHNDEEAKAALAALGSADDAPNNTMSAIIAAIGTESDWKTVAIEPFSSARKWSATQFENHGWVYLGAPDILLDGDAESGELINTLGATGQRLIAIACSQSGPDGDSAPGDVEGLAIVELCDEIRSDAMDIFEYFAQQDVTIKVISGDNPTTVAAISQRAGIEQLGMPVDARDLLDMDEKLGESLEHNAIFGRVAPRQKQAMVQALQADGHVVAMTGDGVNDVLALKDADLGIAMGSGSAATRSAADLVLTNDAFATLPIVVNEGRKVINNVERVANLFVTKAAYAVLLTFVIGIIGSPFPFLPRQLTLIGTFSIGIPGFFLALSPEVTRVKSGFLPRVLSFSIPAGIIAGTATVIAYEMGRRNFDLPLDEARSLATITLLGIGLAILLAASRPLKAWKIVLVAAMGALYALVVAIRSTRAFFEIDLFPASAWMMVIITVAIAGALILVLPSLVKRRG